MPADANYLTATELLRALHTKKASAVEPLEHGIARIEPIDGGINAVVVRDFDRARQAAKAADTARANGEDKPLLGVPITVKEATDVEGLKSTWGVPAFKDFVAKA